jgi:hypothetical protein
MWNHKSFQPALEVNQNFNVIYEGGDSCLRSVEETIPTIIEKPATSLIFGA